MTERYDSHEIDLESGGKIRVNLNGIDLFRTTPRERELILALIELVQSYENPFDGIPHEDLEHGGWSGFDPFGQSAASAAAIVAAVTSAEPLSSPEPALITCPECDGGPWANEGAFHKHQAAAHVLVSCPYCDAEPMNRARLGHHGRTCEGKRAAGHAPLRPIVVAEPDTVAVEVPKPTFPEAGPISKIPFDPDHLRGAAADAF